MLTGLSALWAAALGSPADAAEPRRTSRFGVAAFSYAARLGAEPGAEGLRDPARFLTFCRERGAGGVQIGIPPRDAGDYTSLRRELDRTGCWLEGSVRLPRAESDIARFEAEIQSGCSAGAAVFRTVLQGGRRYEVFNSKAEFEAFRADSTHSLELASRVMTRCKARLAVENHKDYRAEELVEVLRRLGNELVGATVDLGNNIALLESPAETVALLAPYAMSVHLKDMAVEPVGAGFLLSEVPLGTGFLDLPAVVARLRKARPEIRFSVEMATRDPLLVPCLTEKYWASLGGLPASALARMLSLVRDRKAARPLRRVAGLPPAERLAEEDENVRACLRYAHAQLPV